MSDSAIDYRIYTSEPVLVARVSGKLTFAQMSAFLNALFKDNHSIDGMNALYVLTECVDLDGTMQDVINVAEFLNNDNLVRLKSRTAIILPDKRVKLKRYIEGLLLMVSESNIEHAVFSESQKSLAYQFIGLSDEFVSKHLI